jgi:hypothetical protein
MSLDVTAAIAAGQRSIRYQQATSWIGAFAEGGRDARPANVGERTSSARG